MSKENNEQEKIKEGDVVILKSGGLEMTVGKIEAGLCNVYFFCGGILQKEIIPANALEKTEYDSSGNIKISVK